MTHSGDKGKRAEYAVRNLLRDHTGFKWERVPGSGGFSASHNLKGDIYAPGHDLKYCVEVKHYKEEVLTSLCLKNPDCQLSKFWAQTMREAKEVDKKPLLIYKKDRGQWYVATRDPEDITPEITYCNEFREHKTQEPELDIIHIYLFTSWLSTKEAQDFLK